MTNHASVDKRAIARVVLNAGLDRAFDYAIPPELAGSIAVGSRVLVSFGRQMAEGHVIELATHSTHKGALKPIRQVVGDRPYFGPDLLRLMQWMAEYYCCTLDQALRAALPSAVRTGGMSFKQHSVVKCVEGVDEVLKGLKRPFGKAQGRPLTAIQQAVLEKVRGCGPMPLADVGKQTVGSALREALRRDRQSAPPHLQKEGDTSRKDAKAQSSEGDTSVPLGGLAARRESSDSVSVKASYAVIRALVSKGLVEVTEETVNRAPLKNRTYLKTEPLVLSDEQRLALEQIVELLGVGRSLRDLRVDVPNQTEVSERPPYLEDTTRKLRPYLLHGVTGSGKTEVYLQAIEHALAQGRGAIVLVPEIALTPQTVERFVGRFGETRIAILHSHLSDGERHDEWHRISTGAADVVIGARSAIFAPVRNLGLIIVDEEHEPSYKQEDSPPRYLARDVAVMRGHLEGAVVVLGSATPSLESWQNVQSGKFMLGTIKNRVDHRTFPVMRVVDMRFESPHEGKIGIFSRELIEAMRLRLDRREQTILFLNRRGFATSLICEKCGHVETCGECATPFTYHRVTEELRCHLCGDIRRVPAKCPECKDPAFRHSGTGTQRVESIVKACFPKARIQRMDADVTTRKDAYEQILGDFRGGAIDILIGTQMIAKGLDFPKVTLVGVVYADLSLHVPDFRSGERTFQLLAQVAGRAGRGEIPGEVFVQTFTPFHSAVQMARSLNFEGFCDQELALRKQFDYPPFMRVICIHFKGASETKVSYYASQVGARLKRDLPKSVTISEPSPSPLPKVRGQFRYQILIKTQAIKTVSKTLRALVTQGRGDEHVTLAVDIDAIQMM